MDATLLVAGTATSISNTSTLPAEVSATYAFAKDGVSVVPNFVAINATGSINITEEVRAGINLFIVRATGSGFYTGSIGTTVQITIAEVSTTTSNALWSTVLDSH